MVGASVGAVYLLHEDFRQEFQVHLVEFSVVWVGGVRVTFVVVLAIISLSIGCSHEEDNGAQVDDPRCEVLEEVFLPRFVGGESLAV